MVVKRYEKDKKKKGKEKEERKIKKERVYYVKSERKRRIFMKEKETAREL